jgi:hypothetical protein
VLKQLRELAREKQTNISTLIREFVAKGVAENVKEFA